MQIRENLQNVIEKVFLPEMAFTFARRSLMSVSMITEQVVLGD